VLPDGPIVPGSPGRGPAAAPVARAAGDGVESVLAGWWQELLGQERVELDDDFFALGGHSLIVVRLFSKIKKTYGVQLGLSTLFDARTVRQLARLIRDAGARGGGPAPHRSIVALQPKGSRLPLFVISGLGGNVIKFHALSSYLGDDQPVYGLLPRGLDGDAPYHTRVEDTAADFVRAIREVQADGPYRVSGYSFGGAVAYEVAQQLVAQGDRVSLLGLFDTIEEHYKEQLVRSLGFARRMAIYRSEFEQAVSDGDVFRHFWRRLRSKTARTLSRLWPAKSGPWALPGKTLEDANMLAASNYHPAVYPGRLNLFRSTDQSPYDCDDAYLGWGHLIGGGIEVHHIPSDHVSMLQEPAVRSLAEKLRECLDRDLVAASAELEVALR
jgi:thioesterase domain-containing protein/acyl carrier protein